MSALSDSDVDAMPALYGPSDDEHVHYPAPVKKIDKPKNLKKKATTVLQRPSKKTGQGETLGVARTSSSSATVALATASDSGKLIGGPRCLEVFAGSGNLSKALVDCGLESDKVDIEYCDGHDMSQKSTVDDLCDASNAADYKYAHLAPPCNTYSVARFPKIRPPVQVFNAYFSIFAKLNHVCANRSMCHQFNDNRFLSSKMSAMFCDCQQFLCSSPIVNVI